MLEEDENGNVKVEVPVTSKKVTDPELLKQLNSENGNGLKKVTDAKLLDELNGVKKKSTQPVSTQGSKTIVSPSKSGGQSVQDFSPVNALLGGKKPEEQLGALGLPVMGDENKPKQDLFVPPTKGFQEVPTTTQNLPLKELNESQMVSLKEPLIQEGIAKLKLNPNDEDAKYQIAEGYRRNGIDRGAEFYYNDILKTNPTNIKALQGIAYVSQQKGDYATALDNYKKVAAIEPNNVNVANGIAFNAFKIGNFEEAKAVNDAVLASDPKQPNALFTKSLIQNNEGDKEGADKTLTEATDQWLLSQEAPSLVNQAYMDYLTNGGAETFRSQIDPFKGTPFEAAAHTLWEGGKNLSQGLTRMYGNGYNTPESHLGMFQALQGGMETAFGVGMSTPAGMEFIVGLEAADVFTNDYASKILMTPIDVFLPPPTDENGMNTEDELTQRKRALGNAAVSLVALHLAKPAIKTTVKKISDVVPEYSKEQIAAAKQKWDNGEEMNGEEIKQLHQAISSELTPENLKQLSKVTETIPEGTKNVSEVSGKLAAIEPETLAKIPTEISPEKKIEVAPLVEEKSMLETQKKELELSKEKVDDSFHEGIDVEIKVVDESIDAKKKEINEKIKGSGLQVRNVKLKAETPKEITFDEQRKKANEEFGVELERIKQADPKAIRDENGELLTNERKLKTLIDVYDDYRAKLKEIDRQEELSSQPKTETDAVQIEKEVKPIEEIKTEEKITEQDNQPKDTTKESVKEEVGIENAKIDTEEDLNVKKTQESIHDRAKSIATEIGGSVVGSASKEGTKPKDIDILFEKGYDKEGVETKMSELGYESRGSSLVSPEEAKKSGKKYGEGWQRIEHFKNEKTGEKIDVFHPEKEQDNQPKVTTKEGVKEEVKPITKKQLKGERDALLKRSPTNAREAVLQHFAGGGRISTADIKRELGVSGNDLKSKIWAHGNKYPSIDRLALDLKEELRVQSGLEISEDVLRNEIIDVIHSHSGKSTMIDELRKSTTKEDRLTEYDLYEGLESDEIVRKEFKDADETDQKSFDEIDNLVDSTPDEWDSFVDRAIDKFSDENGDININALGDFVKAQEFLIEDVAPKKVREQFQNLINNENRGTKTNAEKTGSKSVVENDSSKRESKKETPKEEIVSPKTETSVIKEKGTDSTTQKAEEVALEQGGEKVVAPTSETEGGKMTGITHEQTNEIARELGFEEYKEKPETIAEWDKEADKRISEGYNIEKLVTDMESGKQPDKIEQRIVAKYVANLKAQVEKAPTDANILELKRVVDTSNISGGREVAKSLRARVGEHPIDDSLAGFFLREMDVNKDAPLTENQKSTVIKEHTGITEAQKKYDEKIATLEAENAKLRAEAEFKKSKATTKKTKKTREDFVAERKSLIEQFKEEGKFDKNKPQAQGISLTNKQVEIIGKLVKSYVEEGISKLEDVVSKIAGELGVEKKDVHDVLAGEYNPKKKTRSEIAATIIDLKEQARLTNKLDALLRGEVPKNEKQKIQRNQEIEGLRKQIKDLQKEKADAERKIIEDRKAEEKAIKDAEKLAEKEELNAQKAAQKQAEKEAKEKERIANQKTPEEQALANLKKRYAGEIKNLEEQIKTGDFSKPSDKPKLILDAEARKLKDDLIKLKKEREVRLLKQQYEQRTVQQKATDKVIEVLNIPRTLMSSMDFSAPLRQAIVATIAHPTHAAKAGAEMFKQAFSQKQFDRWFYDVKDHPRFERSQESGLYIADPHDPRLTAKEEAFMNNLAEKIPVVGKLIKGSERAYVGYLNKMRWDLFNRFADAFEAKGKTFENSPELYKGLASYVNNSTGRGKLGALESAAPILNAGIFAPRLIASRLNLLNPLYYKSLPKPVRVQALKDMGAFIGLGMTVLGLAYFNGAEVEKDPRSSDFGKIKDKNTRWDIWGGFQPYMRVLTQLFTGQSKSSSTGNIQELDGEGAFGRNRGDVVWNFMRGKLAPVPSMAVNFLTGKTMTGEDVTIKSEAIDHLLPMIAGDLKDAITDRGTRAFFEVGIPSTFGIGTSTYLPRGYEKVGNKDPIYKFLYDNHLNLNEPQQGELTDGEYAKMLELREPIFKKKWQDIIDKGALINKEGKVTTDKDDFVKKKPIGELTQQELSDLMKAVGNSATRVAKKKVESKSESKSTAVPIK